MRINEIVSNDADTDPAIRELLLKLHKGATAGFNGKKTQQVLSLFPGWTMAAATLIKPSDETREALRNISFGENSRSATGIPTWRQTLHASAILNPETKKYTTRLKVQSFSEAEAKAMQAQLAKFAVSSLPDPKRAKPDDLFVMDMSTPVEKAEEGWIWSFDLYRKCKGYTITAPDGQRFDVCGPVQLLGYAGTTDFGMFFTWALANTNLEEEINAKLGLSKFVKAADRPRVPVGGQIIGTCAICSRAQVVRNGVMVNHGYQRPGHGYIFGECFGTGRDPYETSAKACVEYVPSLEHTKATFEARLADLNSGKIKQFVERKHNWRTNKDENITIVIGTPEFDRQLKGEIANVGQQIKYVTADIVEMRRRITDWKPGTLRRNEG
jgi:hypothetical protein